MVYVMDRRSEKNSLFFCLGLTTIGQMVGNGNRHNYWLSHVHQTTQDQQQTNSDYSNCRIVELVKHMKSTFVWRSVSNIIEIIHMILKSAAFFRPFPFWQTLSLAFGSNLFKYTVFTRLTDCHFGGVVLCVTNTHSHTSRDRHRHTIRSFGTQTIFVERSIFFDLRSHIRGTVRKHLPPLDNTSYSWNLQHTHISVGLGAVDERKYTPK